jgi:hypothetical protein
VGVIKSRGKKSKEKGIGMEIAIVDAKLSSMLEFAEYGLKFLLELIIN